MVVVPASRSLPQADGRAAREDITCAPPPAPRPLALATLPPTQHLPSLDDLGRDLIAVPLWRRALALAMPFAVCAAFFVVAARGWWLAALASAMELISFRSGHAYRFTHLHHHASFPADDDVEAEAVRMSFVRALFDGITMQPRLWLFAFRRAHHERAWIVAEGIAVVALLLASLAVIPLTPLPAVYAALMIAGSWTFPIITVWIPHIPTGDSELTRTRLFRGAVIELIAVEHLYHLEHHLYPRVPHQNWRRLARRLDPYFATACIHPVKLFF